MKVPLPQERSSVGGAQARLRLYMAGLLVLAAVVFGITQMPAERGAEVLPQAREEAPPQGPPAPLVDLARVPASDDEATHARWQEEGLTYLLEAGRQDLSPLARPVTAEDLAVGPFAEARGAVFEVRGTVREMVAEERRGAPGHLWVVVLEGAGGQRVVVLKDALASDEGGGRPEDALSQSTDYVQVGDTVLARGVYLQRRTGTLGAEIFREPVPVLVATPPVAAFRKVLAPAVAIDDPREADWDEVEDRFLRDTQRWEEPALFQTLQWARSRGHDALVADLKGGRVTAEPWTQATFGSWSEEVESDATDMPRPFTQAARGRLWKTTGLVANYVRQGWDAAPREASAWGVDEIHTLDVKSDHYGNTIFRTVSAFPLSAYAGVTGAVGQHVTVYGYFLKNFTYSGNLPREEGGRAIVTMPMYLVVHVEPVVYGPSEYRAMVWVISGAILFLAVLFYFVLIRGEKRESRRMEAYRTDLRRRIRAHERGRKDAAPPSGGAAPP